MANHSAAEVISPAIARTRQFLFAPFRLGRFLKLTLVAVLTEGGMESCNFNSGGHSFSNHSTITQHPMPHLSWPAGPMILGAVLATVLLAILLGILIGYLLIRLRFSFFECVLYGRDQIAPAWRHYHRQAVRYLGLSVCVSLVFLAVLAAAGYAFYLHYKPLFDTLGTDNPPSFAAFLPLIAMAFPLLLLVIFAGYLVETTLSCFVLPHMALEDASIGDSLEDVWNDMLAEPGQFALFYLFRILLTIAATILGLIVLLIPLLVIVLAGVVAWFLLKAMPTVALVALGIPAAILAACLLLVAFIGVSGTIGTFRRNYAILFYAGRYPRLAAIVWPPTPTPPLPPWEPGTVAAPGV